jgi:flagellar biosynthesis activator protein FlaF
MYAAQQLETYRTVQNTTVSGREIEAFVLTRAAVKLAEIRNNWDSPNRDAKLDEALRNNQIIWSIFQGELMKHDNPLPKKLKQDILSLSTFIDKRTFEVMAQPAPEKLEVIINLNLNLAAGLRGQS